MEPESQPADVVKLFGTSDPRYGALYQAIIDTIEEHNDGLLFVGLLGVLRLIENEVIRYQREDAGLP